MESKTLVQKIVVLEDGKIKATVIGAKAPKVVYLQPFIVVDSLNGIESVHVRGINKNVVLCDTSISEIDGVSFSGNYAALESALRDMAKKANGLLIGGTSGGGGGGDATEATQLLVKDELTSIDNRLEIKNARSRFFLDLNNAVGGAISFPVTLGGDFRINTNGVDALYPVSGTFATSNLLITYLNGIQGELILEQKGGTEYWILPGTNNSWGNVLQDSINLFASPPPAFRVWSQDASGTNNIGIATYIPIGANSNIDLLLAETITLVDEQKVTNNKLAATFSQNDIIINQNNTIIGQNNELIGLSSGASNTSNVMPTKTQANVVGVEYMLMTFRAVTATTIILKDLGINALTNDDGLTCIYLNPIINNSANITYDLVMGSSTIEQGTIQSGNPTPQTRDSGGLIRYCMPFQGNSASNVSKLNQTFVLNAGDVIFFGVIPSTSTNLDAEATVNYLQK